MDLLEKEYLKCDKNFQHGDIWNYYYLSDNVPAQGWKIHISSQIKDAVDIFKIVYKISQLNNCSFKVVKNLKELKKINSPREMSPTANKFITLYPNSESEAKSMIFNLTSKLSEFKAQKILSDYQCGLHSPVHYRYGAFLKKQAYDEKNKKVIYLLLDESNNNYVEDRRQNFPSLPSWKKDLFSEEEKKNYFQTAREISTKDSTINKYKMEKIIKRSNKGNVYRAIRRSDGQKVIIKQSRPFVNYDDEGEWTAIDDIKNEAFMLKKLANKTYTTNLIDEFYIVDDYFIVQEMVDGLNFEEFIKETEANENIREKSLNNIVDIVNDVHELGYKLVDIGPTNFIYTKKGDVILIDLEALTPIEDKVRRIKTPMMVNPDTDLTTSSVQQDYFSLALIGFFLLTGDFLSFSKGDPKTGLSVFIKICHLIKIANLNNKITKQQEYWLYDLLMMSQGEKIKKIKHLQDFPRDTLFNTPDFLSYFEKYNFKEEALNIKSYLITKSMDKLGRLFPSNGFGEFVSPASFQHGFGGFLFFMNKFYVVEDGDTVKEWITNLENYEASSYLHGSSLLFGEAGLLFGILDRYEKTKEIYLIDISKRIVDNLMKIYDNISNFDFAIGKSGILLSLMKYYTIFNDKDLGEFIKIRINDLYVLLDSDKKEGIYFYNFAHGCSGIAYVLTVYTDIFGDIRYQNKLQKFSDEISELLEEKLSSFSKLDNLGLSWCEGISGLILYLCLIDKERYSDVIYKSQLEMVQQYETMGTTFCHGLSSLLQTAVYNKNQKVEQLIKRILLTRSYRKDNGLLLFQGEDGMNSYFDFGVGSIGIYWVLLGYTFPFELSKGD